MRPFVCILAACSLALAGAASAEAAAPSPRASTLAHQIYEALGGAAQMTAMQDRMITPLLAALPAPTGAGKDLRADMAAFVRAEMTKFTPQITAASERVYAETFTEAELQDILTFYRSPTGRAFAVKLPEIGARTVAALTPVLRQVEADTLNHVCDLQGCTADQKAQIAKLTGG